MAESLEAEARAFADDLVSWRREIHRIPETDLSLPQTSSFVQRKLTELGVPFTTLVDGNAVVAQLGQGEPCILLRADMDALPICENSGEPFASQNGNMHACGHDMHATALLGAARLLKAHEAELEGTVKLIFQPGEETFHGARAAIEDGVLENPHVDAAFGMHIISYQPLNTVAYGVQAMTGVYGFRITVTGKGCHGSAPEDGIDPIVAGAHVVLALQELIAREKSPLAEASLTLGSFQSGSAFNIIPGTAVLEGSLRVFDPAVRTFLVQRINEVVPAVAAAYRATATVEDLVDVPPLVCDPQMNGECVKYLSEALPEVAFSETMHVMPSEDFALYAERVPSSFMTIGGAVDGETYPHHNAKVRFNEAELPQAAAGYAAVALGWLADHREK